MATPNVDSIELTSGSEVVLTTDPAAPAYNEFALYGSNLDGATSVELDSGEDYSWVVASMSASANSITISAYAFGQSSGTGTVYGRVITADSSGDSPTIELDFVVLPLLD